MVIRENFFGLENQMGNEENSGCFVFRGLYYPVAWVLFHKPV